VGAARGGTDGEPTRQSVVSRERAEKGRLFRLALDPDGRPFVDVMGRAPGRGVYVEPEALEEALGAKAMGRAFRGRARTLSGDEIASLIAETRARLEVRILELLGLARRAGGLTVGMDASREAIGWGKAKVVVLARDLSDRSRAKVMESAAALPRIEVGTIDTLGQSLGREAVGVAVIEHAVFARRALIEAERREKLPRGRSTDG
jgi:predicted RNA-binding protein YlxR (DUF448 family)/ribosomal protein L30E